MGLQATWKSLIAIAAATSILLTPAQGQAYECCDSNTCSWTCWLGGAVLGAAAGAATGYAAGNRRHGKGREGPRGPAGKGFHVNQKDALRILRTSSFTETNVVYSYRVIDPAGRTIVSVDNVSAQTPPTETILPADEKKLEGVYHILFTITTPSQIPTSLGDVAVFVNDTTLLTLVTPVQDWAANENFIALFQFIHSK